MPPTHYLHFRHCGEIIHFSLPGAEDDFVQGCMYKNGTFWEVRQLNMAKKFFPQNGIFVDVGAFVGNHSVYAAKFFNAKKIFSFEPQDAIFSVLKTNIQLNNIENKVHLYPVALTEKKQMMSVARNLPGTRAGTTYGYDERGKTQGMPLDSYEIFPVDMLKIDVEGEELSVLKGATSTIVRSHPVIWLEICSDRCFAEIYSFLQNFGYFYYKPISEMDYLFFSDIIP